MSLVSNSLAAAVGSSVKNVQFQPSALNIKRKIMIIGTYDPLKTLIVDEVPAQILSPEDAGNTYGFGFMIHRLAVQAYQGSNGVETWVCPQAEAVAAVMATGQLAWTATGVLAGTVYLYIAGILVSFQILAGATAEEVSDAAVAAINAVKELPVTASKVAVTFETKIDSKTLGPWGNDISITLNRGVGEVLPTGLTAVITDMASGSGLPTIADALDGLGTGDDANENFFTDVVHGYGQDTTNLDAISTYVGAGNDFIGLYEKTVSRPFRVLTGDVAEGSTALTTLIALGDGRKTDRANGVIAVPGSKSHPGEIAAQTIGHMARINNDRAAQSYIGIALIGIDLGDLADRWTSEYDNRDFAVKAGVSPTRVQNGVVNLQNVVSFYHPDSVPVESNGYRSMRNISILQNIMANVRTNFEQDKWQGISIVQDTARVSSTTDREKARDIDSVIDDLVSLARAFEGKAWIYTADFTIEKLKEAGAVVIRPGNTGFNSTLSIILSGEGGIIDTVVEFDTSIAVLTA